MPRKKPTTYNKNLDDLTVAELLAIGPDELSRMSQKDIQRIVRTTSLAANKRINRLLENSVKRNGAYQAKKSSKYTIAPDALNWMIDENKARTGKKKGTIEKFGVGDKTDKQSLMKELGRIRKFMSMKTSTIKGATEVRRTREKKATGKTREDVIKKAKTKKEVKQMLKEYEQHIGDVYEQFRKYIETYHPASLNKRWEKYTPFQGSEAVLNEIRYRVANGDPEDHDTLEQLNRVENEDYETQQEQMQQEQEWFLNDDNEDDDGFTYIT